MEPKTETNLIKRRRRSSLIIPQETEESFSDPEIQTISTVTSTQSDDQGDTLWSILKSSLRNKKLRSLMILYGICSACVNSEYIIAMLFIQEKWEAGGLEVSAENLSNLSLLAFFPSVLILLYSDRVVPDRISIISFSKSVIIVFAGAVLLFPVLRDLIPADRKNDYLVKIIL